MQDAKTSPVVYFVLASTNECCAHVFIDHDVCASQVESCQSNAECINRRKASVCSCVPGVNEDSGLCHGEEI